MTNALLAVAVLAAIVLIVFGVIGLRRPGPNLRPALMIAAGIVTLVNVWLNTLPVPGA
jgi:hypothetical protein